jgi:hypothetical protein
LVGCTLSAAQVFHLQPNAAQQFHGGFLPDPHW